MPKTSVAFVNYRRDDSTAIAHGLRAQLAQRFGARSIFMDVTAIYVGSAWAERLTQSLANSTVLLALIGPRWLVSADQYGRRRLDKPDDWVRQEIMMAIDLRIPILPLLIGGTQTLPHAEGLPPQMVPMLQHQSLSLRDDHWDADVTTLANFLASEYGFPEPRAPVLPSPEKTAASLSEAEITAVLSSLPGWEAVESAVPGDYPKTRRELRRAYRFKSFLNAVDFMSSAARICDQAVHHPRWENQWRTVTVYLSTWDIGHRISEFDVKLARLLDLHFSSAPGARP